MTANQTDFPSDTILPNISAIPTRDDGTFTHQQNVGVTASATARFYDDLTAMLWYTVPPALLLLGTFGNVMTVVVMRGMAASKSTACLYFYFTALAVSDQCTLATSLTFYWVDMGFSWPPSFFRFDILCSVPKFLWNVSGVFSAWVLVAMTYQRVTSVVAPIRVGVLCTVKRGKVIVGVIVMAACAVHGQFLLTWAYWPDHRKCQYREEYMRFAELFEWLDLVFASMLPFLLLVAGNSVLIGQVIQARQLSSKLRGSVEQPVPSGRDRVNSMTRTLIVTSAVFLVLTLPVCIFDVCVQMTYHNISDEEVSAMIKLIRTIVTILWFSASASNFYLYVLSGNKFREETGRYLCCHNRQSAKRREPRPSA
ncbi:hypothetical protein ACOMHN_026225 [Nucella lapillus]